MANEDSEKESKNILLLTFGPTVNDVTNYWLALGCANAYEVGKGAASKVPEKADVGEMWKKFEKAKSEGK